MPTSSNASDRLVPFLDAGRSYAELREDIDRAVNRVLTSGWYLLGEETAAFEREFAAYCGTRHCIAVSNGLDALHLVLRAWGVGAGDEVLVPGHTFIATWLAVAYAGAVPVAVDVDPHTYNLDPALIERAITPRTKAIIPVHLYGQPADMDAINAIAVRRGVKVLEDAAQAHGATYRGRRAGALGDAGAFSFYPAKNLGAFGDGGAVTTNDADVARRVRQFANYGAEQKYVHTVQGFNCRLDEIQAAVLRVKLAHLEEWNQRRRALAQAYTAQLAGAGLVLPDVPAWAGPAWHLFVVQSSRRDALRAHLAKRGIETLIHYPTPPFLQPPFADGRSAERLPVSAGVGSELLSLPIGPHLAMDDLHYVVSCILDA